MKWRREIDYHGSRSYGSGGAPGQFTLIIAWLREIAKSRLRKLRSQTKSRTVLLKGGEHKFSVLGGEARRRAADCPFPAKAPIADRDWRVLP